MTASFLPAFLLVSAGGVTLNSLMFPEINLRLGQRLVRITAAGAPSKLHVQSAKLDGEEDGSKAVGLFNLGDSEKDVAATWADLGISGKRAVRDLWRQEDLGRFDREFQARVAPHGVVLVRISAAGE